MNIQKSFISIISIMLIILAILLVVLFSISTNNQKEYKGTFIRGGIEQFGYLY